MKPSTQRRATPSLTQPQTSARMVHLAGAVLAAAGAFACSGSSSSGSVVPPSGAPLDNGLGSYFIATPHQNGTSNDLRISGLEWGRLVDVFDTTGDPQAPISLVFQDLLIDHTVTASTLDYEFAANPVSGKEFVIVNYPRESGEFQGVLNELMDTQPVPPKGLGANVLPPFTAVARNSALVINLNDLIDADTVDSDTVRLLAGDPPSLPFEGRVVPSTTHGALLGGTYYTTRVIVDFTVSTLEALDDPDISVNTLGLPSAQQVNAPNAALRIATKTGPGQFTLLTNLSGRSLNFASAGPSDPNSPTLDVVRSFRSQGKTEVTGDVNNGFLPDEIPPSVLGTQGVFAQQNDPGDLALMDVTFLTPSCVMPLRVGDILEFSDFVFQVVTPGQLAGNMVVNTRVVALVGELDTFGPSFGLFKTTWSPTLGAPPECFVRFDPQPGVAPATDVGTGSTIIAEFSEPMDPARVQALKTLRVAYDVPPLADNPMYASVVGRILPAADLKSFVFSPSLPLRHTSGTSETFFVELTADDPSTGLVEGVTDLAGNALQFELPSAPFTLEATQATGGYALRFIDPQADEDDNGKPDIRGQYVIDPRQVVKPRGFQRFSVLIDDNQPLISAMFPTAITIQTPLSDKGSKTQLVWRYIDMGFGLLDDQFHNLDLEGMSWASFAPSVANDKFTNFSITATHASVFPDEVLDGGLLPAFRFSGLTLTFDNNLLDLNNVLPTTMASKDKGYSISASDAFPAPLNSQVLLVPWPINRGIPQSQFTYWTWRDTSMIQAVGPTGGNHGQGVDPGVLATATSQAGLPGFYPMGMIPTIGLPMLTEYRTYPDTGAFAINGAKTSFAINSSYRPCFRAFSTGGIDAQGQTQLVDPDNEPIAQGGYNINGVSTGGIDNTVYWGQADFVVRVSRFHTVWYDSTATGSQYAPVVVEPEASELPSGTTVAVHFRGASNLAVAGGAATPPQWTDATRIDPYGDAYNQAQLDLLTGVMGSQNPFTVTYFPSANDKSWKSSASDLNGARYLQMRVTMTANADSGLTPEVSAIGVAYSNP